ncbi:YlxR family protein [Cellulomonas sp. 179-A 9B4 NHS]|uniref:YlxR family protein n=1 Tax=Cellulomonas sp. 179-A 9B4 NHS TaxID=3142379 RepID=UPI0039A19C68
MADRHPVGRAGPLRGCRRAPRGRDRRGVRSRPVSRRGRLTEAGPEGRLSTPSRRTPDPVPPVPDPGPVRTCVGCRSTGPRSALLRVVLGRDATGEPVLVADERRRMPGRGAWLHPDPHCLELAVRRRAFGRALRHAGPLGTEVVAGAVHRYADQPGPQHDGVGTGPTPTVDRESGLEADGDPMSTQR